MTGKIILYMATYATCSVAFLGSASINARAATISTITTVLRAQAEQGDAKAQCVLGLCYLYGARVTEDKEKAATWFRKAAEQGYAAAQFYLGKCYYNGDGVIKDFKKSAGWFRQAAEQGFFAAQYNLGLCYAQGHGVIADKAEAARWFHRAAEQNYPAAQYNLGVFYYMGDGVNKAFIEAYTWLSIARAAGVAEADALCKLLTSKMTTAQILEVEARVKKWQQEHAASRPGIK